MSLHRYLAERQPETRRVPDAFLAPFDLSELVEDFFVQFRWDARPIASAGTRSASFKGEFAGIIYPFAGAVLKLDYPFIAPAVRPLVR